MSFSMASLLIGNDDVPVAARWALRAAQSGPSDLRQHWLESAAWILHREMGVTCRDARELVDLAPAGTCG